MSWLNMTEAELNWGVYHAGEALSKLHRAGQFDKVYVKGMSVGPYMEAWNLYNMAVSAQRRGWQDREFLGNKTISFMLHSASQGDIEPPRIIN